MPTTRPRYQVTETDEVERALNVAARRWPGEPRSKLLIRLVQAGVVALEEEQSEAIEQRRAAVDATSGKYGDLFDRDYLERLRADWPE